MTPAEPDTMTSNKSVDPALIEALRSQDRETRDKAAAALVEAGRSAVPALVELLGDPGRDFRDLVIWVLVRSESPP
jgi:HEAT repeat protein